MEESPLQTPHDHIIKSKLGEPKRMAAFLRSALPKLLIDPLGLRTLKALPGSFLDEHLRHRQTDLLFSVEWEGSPLWLYILFEHQSTSDAWMPLRLLRYMIRIWEDFQKNEPKATKLPLILPIVFYQGLQPWPVSPDFADLVEMPVKGEPWTAFIPNFRHEVLNLSDLDLDKLNDDLSVQVLLKLMRAVILPDPKEAIREGFNALADLLNSPNEMTFLRTCLTYLTNAGNKIDAAAFLKQIKTLEDSRLKAEAMTIAEQLKKMGREEGRQEGREAGRQEGREEGIVEGISQGIVQGERLLLERQLARKFGALPEWVGAKLDTASPSDLEKWAEAVLDARDLNELFRA